MTVTQDEMWDFFDWLGDPAKHKANCTTFRTERDAYVAGKRNDIPSFRNKSRNFDPATAKDIGLERDVAYGNVEGINVYFGAGFVGPLYFIR